MKDARRPSKAMVDKLLKNNGFKAKLSDFIRNSAYRFGLPLMHTIDIDKKIALIESHIDENAALEAYTQVYAKYFSVEEILDIIAFYKSPTGQKLVQTQEIVASEIADEAQRLIGRIVMKTLNDLDQTSEPKDPYGFEDLNDTDRYEPLQ